MKDLLRKVVTKGGGALARLVAHENRDWECPHFILAAQAIMTFASWRDMAMPLKLAQKEFRVFSQYGDDGIIQYLIHVLQLKSDSFIEFGVADFYESNSHFLLVNNNWRGFVIDGSADNIHTVKNSPLYWRYDLQAECSFVTAENINQLLAKSGFNKIGLLHIDLDGNDYWVLKALDLSIYQPDILILEYNAHFGVERSISVPYDPGFYRMNAHYSGQYFGASLAALDLIAEEKGYYFIGCNSAGNNAYFLRDGYQSIIPQIVLQEGFVDARFRDSRDQNGNLVYCSRESAKESIRGMPVVNVVTGKTELF
jgi:hypothetical protein